MCKQLPHKTTISKLSKTIINENPIFLRAVNVGKFKYNIDPNEFQILKNIDFKKSLYSKKISNSSISNCKNIVKKSKFAGFTR